MNTPITREEIIAAISAGEPLYILEALPSRYFDQGHLPGALNMPHDQVEQLAAQLLPDKSAKVIVYCASLACRNSGIACQALQKLGYSNVFEYEGGKEDWVSAGESLQTKEFDHAEF